MARWRVRSAWLGSAACTLALGVAVSGGTVATAQEVVLNISTDPDTWVPDRSDVSEFGNAKTDIGGRSADQILALTIAPPSNPSSFNNWQGYKQNISPITVAGPSFIRADLYIPSDWATGTSTDHQRTGLWGSLLPDEIIENGTQSEINSYYSSTTPGIAFPIISFTNYDGVGRVEVWDPVSGGGWVDIPGAADLIDYDGWNTFEARFTGDTIEYVLNGVVIYEWPALPDPEGGPESDRIYEIFLNGRNNGVTEFTSFWSALAYGYYVAPGETIEFDDDYVGDLQINGGDAKLGDGKTITGDVEVNNGGMIEFGENSKIEGDLNLGQGGSTTGGSVDNPAQIDGNVDNNGGTLGGNLDITGDYTGGDNPDGNYSFSPGTSPGIINIGGNFNAGAGESGLIEIDISAATQVAGVTHDQVNIGQDLTIPEGDPIEITLESIAPAGATPQALAPGEAIVITIGGDVLEDGTEIPASDAFAQANRLVTGPYDYVLHFGTSAGTHQVSVVSRLSEEFVGAAALTGAVVQANVSMLGTLAERRGLDFSPDAGRIWARASAGTFDTGHGPVDYDHDIVFGQAGFDLLVSERVRAGFMFGYGSSDVSLAGYGGSAPLDGNVGLAAVYGTYAWDGIYFDLVAGYHFSDWTFTESVWRDRSSYDVDGFIGAVELGYGMRIGEQLTLTPWGQLIYQTISADTDADVPSSAWVGRLGLRASAEFEGVSPYLSAGLITDFGSGGHVVQGPERLSVRPYGTAFEASVGLEAGLGETVAFYGEVGGLVGSTTSGFNGSAGIRVRW